MPTLFQINSKLDHGAGKTDLPKFSIRTPRHTKRIRITREVLELFDLGVMSLERSVWEQQNYLWLYI